MGRHRFESAEFLILDGVRRDGREPALLANLPGVLRGEGIFETFLIRDGQPTPWLDRHEARLRLSARTLGMDLAGRGLLAELPALLDALPATGLFRARFTVLRGLDRSLLRMWTAGPAGEPASQVALLWSRFRQDPACPLVGAKTTSRAAYQVAHAEAVEAGCFDALLPTIDGDVAECTAANVFCWLDGALCTPGIDRGILAGVTRERLLLACQQAEIPVREQRISVENLRLAQEVFISNAVIGVIPVDKIKGLREDYPGASGRQLASLREAYAASLPDPEPRLRRKEES